MIHAADLFAGAGGASTGLHLAATQLGVDLNLVAINHWPAAVRTHAANHPNALHLCQTVESVDPREVVPGGRLHLLLAGPECVHHSRARGGRPVNDQSRASAWHLLRWLELLTVDRVLIENVVEFEEWAPIGSNGRPLKSRKGETSSRPREGAGRSRGRSRHTASAAGTRCCGARSPGAPLER